MRYDFSHGNPLRGSEPLLTIREIAEKYNKPNLLDAAGKGRRIPGEKGFPAPAIKGGKDCAAARYRLSEIKAWLKSQKGKV